jgi:hypothetical protein
VKASSTGEPPLFSNQRCQSSLAADQTNPEHVQQ